MSFWSKDFLIFWHQVDQTLIMRMKDTFPYSFLEETFLEIVKYITIQFSTLCFCRKESIQRSRNEQWVTAGFSLFQLNPLLGRFSDRNETISFPMF